MASTPQAAAATQAASGLHDQEAKRLTELQGVLPRDHQAVVTACSKAVLACLSNVVVIGAAHRACGHLRLQLLSAPGTCSCPMLHLLWSIAHSFAVLLLPTCRTCRGFALGNASRKPMQLGVTAQGCFSRSSHHGSLCTDVLDACYSMRLRMRTCTAADTEHVRLHQVQSLHVSMPAWILSETESGCVAAGRPGLLVLDISGGKESRRIPVFNQVDGDQPPTDLEYIRYPCTCMAACLIADRPRVHQVRMHM